MQDMSKEFETLCENLPGLMYQSDAARFLHVSSGTIKRLIDSNALPAKRQPDGHIAIRGPDLANYCYSHYNE